MATVPPISEDNIYLLEEHLPLLQDAEYELGDLLCLYLEQMGVEYVFGVPGGAIEPLYNALSRSARRGGPRPVVSRHETGAAFMAQGYAYATGRLGVCCTTTGPGATNILTGVASAYQEEVPMLVITAQTPIVSRGGVPFQDSSTNGVDTLGLFSHITRYNAVVTDITQLEDKLAAAVMAAYSETPGPVHITIPTDVLRTQLPIRKLSRDLYKLTERASLIDKDAVRELWNAVRHTRNYVILVGDACVNCMPNILKFAELVGAPVVTTPGGKGLIDPFHPLYNGVAGFAGHQSARDTLSNPDVEFILAVGTDFSEWDTAGWDREALLNKRLIHIDLSRQHLANSPMAHMHVHGDICKVFEYLIGRVETGVHGIKGTYRGCNQYKSPQLAPPVLPVFLRDEVVDANTEKISARRLMLALASRCPHGTRYLADVGNSIAWSVHYLHPRDESGNSKPEPGWYRTSTRFASMGWAIGNAIGVALSNRHAPVVCITGDGSVLMNGQELTVAVAEALPVIFVVLNDQALGMVKHGQRLAGAEQIAFDLPAVDFCAVAKGMGAEAYRIVTHDDLDAIDFDAIFQRAGPTLLDVCIDPDEVPPINSRIDVLRGEE